MDAWNEVLEARILEQPDDLAAHAVYADWLQERGDPRGELMAAAVALAASHESDPVRFHALRQRLEQVDALKPAILGPALVAEGARLRLVWTLGLVSRAMISDADDPDGLLAALAARPAGRLVGLVAVTGLGAGRALDTVALGATPALRVLTIESRGGPEADYRRVWAAAPRLELLSQRGAATLGTIDAPRLRDLFIDLGLDTIAALAALASGNLPQLARLTIVLGEVSRDVLVPLAGARLPALRALTVHSRLGSFAPFVRALAGGPLAAGLVELGLYGVLDQEAADALVAARPRLARLANLQVAGGRARETRQRFFGR